MADADEATNALIAKMLAEDEAYDDVYGIGYDEESEEEWGRKKKKKRGGGGKGGSGGSAKRRKPKEVDPNQEYTETGRKKRKDAGKARTAPRAWNEEEERLFREALRLYGRSWKECAAHVGTRDQRSFTSHAQKYFIKMCLQGKPLPRKVAESGEGYTLSGKPLDPNSAAARAYGFKPDTLDKLMEAGGLASGSIEVGGDGKLTSGLADGGVGEGADELPVPTSAAAAAANKENLGGPNGETMPGVGREVKPKAKPRRRPKEEPALAEPVEPTEYAKNRPRRENAGKGGKATYQSYMSGGLNQIPCRDFTGVVGSVGTSSQPFFVEISDEAQLVADFHAHLSKYEVIGYLGGEWDPASRRLTIRRAFPCKGLEGTQQTDSCEMDPASEIEAKQKMDDWGLQVSEIASPRGCRSISLTLLCVCVLRLLVGTTRTQPSSQTRPRRTLRTRRTFRPCSGTRERSRSPLSG